MKNFSILSNKRKGVGKGYPKLKFGIDAEMVVVCEVTEINYLVVGKFHDFLRSFCNYICDIKFLGFTNVLSPHKWRK